jgi:adenine/guanine phosphoribosyltransferase-like PRPP-binding protein
MLEEMKRKIQAVEYLRLLKSDYTYEKLSRKTGLPTTVLNRYIVGRVLPSLERAEKFIKLFDNEYDLRIKIRQRIKFDAQGYFDNFGILFDTQLLKRISEYVCAKFKNVDKVLTSETDGIPLATSCALMFGCSMVFAKKSKEVGVREFVEESYIPSSSGTLMSLYLPSYSIKRGENVLVVDDVIRSGETQNALTHLARKLGAHVVGIFVIVSIGRQGKRLLERENLEIFVEM